MKPILLPAAALALLVGCSTTPENRYITLSVEPASSINPVPRRAERTTLAKLRLPGTIDRPQLVVQTGAQTVDIREFDRWAEPLDQLVPRILDRDIALREGTPAPDAPVRQLFVSVDQFAADGAGGSELTGRWWTLRPGEEAAHRRERPFVLTRPTKSEDGAQIAAAMSALLGMLADDIARD